MFYSFHNKCYMFTDVIFICLHERKPAWLNKSYSQSRCIAPYNQYYNCKKHRPKSLTFEHGFLQGQTTTHDRRSWEVCDGGISKCQNIYVRILLLARYLWYVKEGEYQYASTLNSPIIVGHNHFLEPMLILITRINVGQINIQPTLIF
jgi:hypothetical protein